MTEDFDEWRNMSKLSLKFMIAPKVKKFCMVGNGKRGEIGMIYSSRLFTLCLLDFDEARLVKPPSLVKCKVDTTKSLACFKV